MKNLLLILGLVLSSQAFACMDKGFMPENDLWIDVDPDDTTTRQSFFETIDSVEKFYGPIIAAQGGRLQLNRLWDNGTVNANASRDGRTYVVNMYGGLARHELTTHDGFALVVCHELGHHLGGIPVKNGWWAATEGQSDYFATAKCLKRVWANDDNVKIVNKMVKEEKVPAKLLDKCSQSYRVSGKDMDKEEAMCIRTAMAGLSSSSLLSVLGGSDRPSFDKKDETVVSVTYEGHPNAQCRLDTYLAGSLCKVSYAEPISYDDDSKGYCSRKLGHEDAAVRPLCWFKPE